jgi:hypothetical protein
MRCWEEGKKGINVLGTDNDRWGLVGGGMDELRGSALSTPDMTMDVSNESWKAAESGVEAGETVGCGRNMEPTKVWGKVDLGGVTLAVKSGDTISGFVDLVFGTVSLCDAKG